MNEFTENLIPLNSPEIKVAIAGMGKMGRFHLAALQELVGGGYEDYYKGGIATQLRKLRICGICDSMAAQMATFDALPKFHSVEHMLEQAQPHILVVATPTQSHKHIALAALNRGIHTLVEKPIVTSVADLNELLKATRAYGAKLMAGHIERYNPVSIKVASLLSKSNPLAQRYSFVRTQKHHARITDDIITDKVIHDLDLALCFFGKIQTIKLDSLKLVEGKPYECLLSIRHENGITGSLFVSWLHTADDKKRQVEILQGGHTWAGDFVSKQLWVDGLEIKCQVEGMVKPANNQIKDELVDFIASCSELAHAREFAPLLNIDEIIESTKWLEHIRNEIIMRPHE